MTIIALAGFVIEYLIGKRQSSGWSELDQATGRKVVRRLRRDAGMGVLLLEVLVVVTILMILLGMAIPSALRVRVMAQEKTAQNSVFLANQSLFDYQSLWGGFPPNITNLTSGGPGNTTCIGQYLATATTVPASGVIQGGYQFTYTPGGGSVQAKTGCSLSLFKSFSYSAVPTNLSPANPRSFYAGSDGVIRMSDDPKTIANSSSSTVFQTETTPGLVLLQGPQGAPGPAATGSSAPQQSCSSPGSPVTSSYYQPLGASIPITVGASGIVTVGISGGVTSNQGLALYNYTLNGTGSDSTDATALRIQPSSGNAANGFMQNIVSATPGSKISVGLDMKTFNNPIQPSSPICISAQTF